MPVLEMDQRRAREASHLMIFSLDDPPGERECEEADDEERAGEEWPCELDEEEGEAPVMEAEGNILATQRSPLGDGVRR